MRSRKKTLILTLDAFETIFVPRHPVANQYIDGARKFNLPFPDNAVEKVQSAFKTTFKTLSSQRPNYGREAALRGEYGGPRQWWEEAIRGSLGRGLVADHDEGRGRAREQEIPQELVEYLLNRFASKKAYTLYDDVDHFLHWTERLKLRCGGKAHDDYAPFDTVLLGVLSNSDDRVPVILQSLGLRVGPARAVAAAAAPAPPAESPSPPGLPGFEDVREPLPARDDAAPSFDPEIPPRLRQALPYQLDFVVTSYQAGAEKPSPAIFDAAKKTALGLVGTGRGDDDDDECVCVHVGDDYQKDYRAAVDAGWDAFFLDRPGNGSVGDADGKRVRSLVELTRKLDDYIYR